MFKDIKNMFGLVVLLGVAPLIFKAMEGFKGVFGGGSTIEGGTEQLTRDDIKEIIKTEGGVSMGGTVHDVPKAPEWWSYVFPPLMMFDKGTQDIKLPTIDITTPKDKDVTKPSKTISPKVYKSIPEQRKEIVEKSVIGLVPDTMKEKLKIFNP